METTKKLWGEKKEKKIGKIKRKELEARELDFLWEHTGITPRQP